MISSSAQNKFPLLVTGAAGFIGFHVAQRYLKDGKAVIGFDNVNDYYDPALKRARLEELDRFPQFTFIEGDLKDREVIEEVFKGHEFARVIHLGAQAGVRYSLVNPQAYVDSNLVGFLNILEACRHHSIAHLVYASSSSVYGANEKMPFSVHDNVDHPLSLYAATKKSNELMAHSYSHLFGLPTTGLRFFTVYGPWGRPDMALYIFAKAIVEGRAIPVFNHGNMMRDFTYIDDIIEGIVRVAEHLPVAQPEGEGLYHNPGISRAPYRVYNIGNNKAVMLKDVIALLEKALGRNAVVDYQPMQPGDVPATWANIDDLERSVGFRPVTSIEEGIGRFVEWFKGYYGI
jgi:UDP-glucuronate 4-epimerase